MGVLVSEVVVIDFVGPEVGKLYVKVNALLGWNGVSGSDTAPAGLISSIADEWGDALVVIAGWESKAQRAIFME